MSSTHCLAEHPLCASHALQQAHRRRPSEEDSRAECEKHLAIDTLRSADRTQQRQQHMPCGAERAQSNGGPAAAPAPALGRRRRRDVLVQGHARQNPKQELSALPRTGARRAERSAGGSRAGPARCDKKKIKRKNKERRKEICLLLV